MRTSHHDGVSAGTGAASRAENRPAPRSRSTASFAITSLVVVGIAGVIAGGLVSAVTAPLHLTLGSWAAAYLVLVWGVAQAAIGAAQRMLAVRPSAAMTWAVLALWNAGNSGVLVGTLVASPSVVVAGSALLLVALVGAFLAVRGSRRRVWAGIYRAFLVGLFVSVFVGIALSALRHD